MKPNQIRLSDVHRLLIGQALLVAMRIVGKRIGAQLTQTELAVVVTLGAAIGVPLQAPDRGMLPALLILAIAVAFQRGLRAWAARKRSIELITQADVVTLVEDGRMMTENMLATTISKERRSEPWHSKRSQTARRLSRRSANRDGEAPAMELLVTTKCQR